MNKNDAQQLSFSAIADAPDIAPLAEQEISTEVLVEKYAKGAEVSVHDVRRRVARALAANENEKQRAKWEERFLWAQEHGFVPAGRINSAAGTPLAATLIDCFVQPVGDSIVEHVDGRPGIYSALAEAAGVSRQTINAIEKGEYNPTINLCRSICKILGKTLDDLFWEE